MKEFTHRIFISLLLGINILVLGAVIVPQPAYAAVTKDSCEGAAHGIQILPKWYKYLDPKFDSATQSCDLTKGFPQSIPLILLAVFEILLRIGGILAVVFVIYGGFQYLTSTGEPDKAKAARTTIINALVGVMIVMFATVFVNVVGRGVI